MPNIHSEDTPNSRIAKSRREQIVRKVIAPLRDLVEAGVHIDIDDHEVVLKDSRNDEVVLKIGTRRKSNGG